MKIVSTITAFTVLILVLCGMRSCARGIHFRQLSTQLNSCINNLRMIESAKASYGLENKLARNADVRLEDFLVYVRNREVPLCPAGGIYKAGLFTGGKFETPDSMQAARCSIHGALTDGNGAAAFDLYFIVSIACFAVAAHVAVVHLAASRQQAHKLATLEAATPV